MILILKLVGGLVLLTSGAEALVRGASALALALRVSPLVIGLTVVAFGTSTPELVVSIQSVLRGQPDIALGNVVGSNVLNVLLILGLSAVIIPLRVSQQLVRFDVPLLIGLSLFVAAASLDGRIGRGDGIILAGGLVLYTVWAVVKSRREETNIEAEYAAEFGMSSSPTWAKNPMFNIGLAILGLCLLVLGSRWFTDSAVTMARQWGFTELVIGLTIVAGGTSLPELATSVVAAYRGERDIAVGNVIGSNLFNLMGVLGISSIVSGAGVQVTEDAMRFDIPVMVAVSVACLPIFFTGHRIARWEGILFLGYYIAYTAYLTLATTNHAVTRTFAAIMLGFVIPLTVCGIAVTVVQSLRTPSDGSDP